MATFINQKTITVSTVGELRCALKDVSNGKPICGSLGGDLQITWLKDEETDDTRIEIEEE